MLNRLKNVFASFQRHEVKYVVIGGIASVIYGVPRATFDLDILIDATPENMPIPMMSPLDSEGSRHPVPIQSARVFRLIPPPLVGA